MATGFFHHIGTFLLLAATILLIVTCISAPVVHDIALLKVDLDGSAANHRTVAFGTFGYCINDPNQADACTPSQVGYSPAFVMSNIDGTDFSDYADDTTTGLTKAMILHPIACGLNFIAFLLALGSGFVGSLLASLIALLAFLTTAVAVIIDFVLFSVVKSNINDNDNGGSHAYYGAAAWTTLVAAICSLVGAVVVFLTCCSGRLHKRRNAGVPAHKAEYVEAPRRRRRFF